MVFPAPCRSLLLYTLTNVHIRPIIGFRPLTLFETATEDGACPERGDIGERGYEVPLPLYERRRLWVRPQTHWWISDNLRDKEEKDPNTCKVL